MQQEYAMIAFFVASMRASVEQIEMVSKSCEFSSYERNSTAAQ
jgi:hypothetical protein